MKTRPRALPRLIAGILTEAAFVALLAAAGLGLSFLFSLG